MATGSDWKYAVKKEKTHDPGILQRHHVVNIQAGCVCETGVVIRADPGAGLRFASIVDLDAFAISLQHIFAICTSTLLASALYFLSLKGPRMLTYRALQLPEMASQVGNRSRE